MRIPVDRMTNWELMDHIRRRLADTERDYLSEMTSDQRETMLDLEAAVATACETLRKQWEYAEEHDGQPMPINECPLCSEPADNPNGFPHAACSDRELARADLS